MSHPFVSVTLRTDAGRRERGEGRGGGGTVGKIMFVAAVLRGPSFSRVFYWLCVYERNLDTFSHPFSVTSELLGGAESILCLSQTKFHEGDSFTLPLHYRKQSQTMIYLLSCCTDAEYALD